MQPVHRFVPANQGKENNFYKIVIKGSTGKLNKYSLRNSTRLIKPNP